MNKLLYLLLFFSLSSIAQKQDCGWFGKMDPEERMKQFPFNKAKRIVLIAFPANIDLSVAKQDPTQAEKYIRTETVALGEHPREDNILHEKELTDAADIDKLSNVMINYKVCKGYPRDVVKVTGCYEPRNGILFYDENNVLICFYEICFECSGAFISPENKEINFLNYVSGGCSERIELLKEIFNANGIN